MEPQNNHPAPYEEYLEKIFMDLRNIAHISSIYSKYLQKTFNITTSQLLSLRALSKEEGLSAGEIGRRIFIKPGTITGIVDRLENKGLVTRVRDNKDRRVVNVVITEAGRLLVQAAPIPIQSRLALNLKELPLEQVKSLNESLNRLVELMQAEQATTEIPQAASAEKVF